MFKYQIVNGFTIERYNQVEKNELITQQLRTAPKSSSECWFEGLTFYDPLNRFLNQSHNILLLQTDLKDGQSYAVFNHNGVVKSYGQYMRAGNSNSKLRQNTIISELTKQHGFEAKRNGGGIRSFRLLKSRYDALMSANVVEQVELDDSLSFASHQLNCIAAKPQTKNKTI
jgi:hypothetical protein